MRQQLPALLLLPLALLPLAAAGQDDDLAVVETALVERMEMTSQLPLNGSVLSRNDVAVTAAVEGELDWVAEPGTRIETRTFSGRASYGDAVAGICSSHDVDAVVAGAVEVSSG